MDPQLLVVLFLLFGVISSLINKFQAHRQEQPDESKLRRKPQPPPQTRPADPFEEEDVDWTDWDIVTGTTPEPEPEPEPEPLPTPPEFQPVQATRPVSEAYTGPEFREIRGARPVEEPKTGTEFRTVEATRPVSDQSSYVEGKTPFVRASAMPHSAPRAKPRKPRRRQRLNFGLSSVRKAIVFNEILGPPRAENMPF